MQMMLSENERKHARWAFRLGSACLTEGKGGNVKALSGAIIYFAVTLEWAMPETWPMLWREARAAMNEALSLRDNRGTGPTPSSGLG